MSTIPDDDEERRTRIESLLLKLRKETDAFHEQKRVLASRVGKRVLQPAAVKRTRKRSP